MHGKYVAPRSLGIAIIVVGAAVLAGCSASSASQGAADTGDTGNGVLRVATTGTNPPWSFRDEGNVMVGYDAAVAEEIAERAGYDEVQFVQDTFQNFIPGLQADKYDMVVSGLTITAERAEQVQFTRPYEVNPVAIFIQPSNTSIQGEDDLAGVRIAVSAGSTQEQLARTFSGAEVLTYENATLALTDLSLGRADAYLGSKFVGAYLAEQNGLDVVPLAVTLSNEVNAITVQDGDDALLSAVNGALEGMITDGTLTSISEEWLGGLDMAVDLAEVPTDPAEVAGAE